MAELVGPVEKPTLISDLDLKTMPRPQPAARGVAPKLPVPGRMQPLRVEPLSSASPFYVKLRAEVDEKVLQSGNGRLYLGFHLDPIYRVHWNNLVAPLHFTLRPPDTMTVTPASGDAPSIKEPSDVDPREFIVQVRGPNSNKPIEVTVKYFACSEEWCKPVTQQYLLHLERDRDAGVVTGRDRAPDRAAASGGGMGAGPDAIARALRGLDLSQEQRTKVAPVRAEFQRKSRAVFQRFQAGDLARPAMRAERLKLNEVLIEELKSVLNPDQLIRFEKAVGRAGPGPRGIPPPDRTGRLED